jgi:nitrous oxide reductase
MKDETTNTDQTRRGFIKKSALAGAGAVAVATASPQVIAQVTQAGPEKVKQKGYQVTPHVMDYYKSADI